MNHYQLYKMIYWRILEATCTVMCAVLIIGALLLKGGYIAWVFWVMAAVHIVFRLCITLSVKAVEDGMGTDRSV